MPIPTQFVPRINYLNPGAPPNPAPNIIPQNLQPIFISGAEMLNRTPVSTSRMIQSGAISITYGLTVPSFSLNYSNFNQQWHSSIRPGTRMQQWEFQGGVVYLELQIGIYLHQVIERARFRNRIVSLIMAHELRHVGDAINIITQIAPPRLSAHPVVRANLVSPQPMDDNTFQMMIRSGGLEAMIRNDIFYPEWNSRVRQLDSGPAYYSYGSNVGNLIQGIQP